MPHLKLTNGQPEKYSIGQLRRDNPQVSFPKSVPERVFADYGVFDYTVDDKPNYQALTQDISEGDFYQLDNGSWRLGWSVFDRPPNDASQRVRSRRDRLLSETDWVVVFHTEKGTNITLEWKNYRQALRDLTAHANFPYLTEDDWPAKP